MSHTLQHWKSQRHVPALTDACCHIWQLDLRGFITDSPDILTPQERQRAEKYHKPEDKQRFITVRSVLRQLLGVYSQLPANVLNIAFNDHGKPFLEHNKSAPLYFNISHAHNLAMLAFSRSADVGIDVEYIDRPVDYRKLAHRFFSEQENKSLAIVNEQQLVTQFYRLWTRKEAFVKAVGTGLRFPLNKFSISTDPEKPPTLSDVDKSIYDGPCFLSDISCQQNYMSALAYLSSQMDCQLYYWPLEQV